MFSIPGFAAAHKAHRAIEAQIAALEKLKSPMTTQNTWIEFSERDPVKADMPITIMKMVDGKLFGTYSLCEFESLNSGVLMDGYTHWFSLPKAPKPPESAEFLAGREAVLSEVRTLVDQYNSTEQGGLSDHQFIHAVAEMVK